MSNSVRPHRRQPTRLPRPWDSPGKNTGVGCHFLLQCMKVKKNEVIQSCLTLRDPMDCSPPGSSAQWDFPGKRTGMGWGSKGCSEQTDGRRWGSFGSKHSPRAGAQTWGCSWDPGGSLMPLMPHQTPACSPLPPSLATRAPALWADSLTSEPPGRPLAWN